MNIHPLYVNYRILNDKVFNIKSNKPLNGQVDSLGYINITVYHNNKRHSIKFHRFKWECMYNKLITDKYHIDHIDGNCKNNDILNLQMISAREHSIKTKKDNPDMFKKIGETLSTPGIAYNSKTLQLIKFNSVNELAKLIESHSGNIYRFINTKKSPPKGFDVIIFYDLNEDLQDEVWKLYRKNTYLSNMGRIKHGKRLTYGTMDHQGYFHYSGKLVHILIMELFGDDKKSNDYTIDHINRNKSDNSILNLRWATKSEQCLNTHRNRNLQITQWNGYTGELIENFNSKKEVLEKNNIKNNSILFHSSIKRDWFICLKNSDINNCRLRFVNSILNYKKNKKKDILGLSDDKSLNRYIYKCNSTKFSNTKTYTISIKKNKLNSYETIKSIAIQHNASICIQCYWRSYIRFKKLCLKPP